MINYNITSKDIKWDGVTRSIVLVEFTIKDGASPGEFASSLPLDTYEKFSEEGLVISGRGPIWTFGMFAPLFPDFNFAGIFDPRLGVVIIQSFIDQIEVGEVWEVAP